MTTSGRVSALVIAIVAIAAHVAYAGEVVPDATADSTGNGVPVTYNDGEGTNVASDSNERYPNGTRCWTDYYVVEHGKKYHKWKKASGNLECAGSKKCQFSKIDGVKTCETWSSGISSTIRDKIVNVDTSKGRCQYVPCYTGSDPHACSWNDPQCHCIWTRQQICYHYGYRRRRCNGGKKDYTAWMNNWRHEAPMPHVEYKCDFKCTDGSLVGELFSDM